EMGVIHVADADLVHLVENVAEVGFTIHADALHRRHDPPDDALFTSGGGVRKLGLEINVEAAQMRQQFAVDEVKNLSVALGEKLLPLPTIRSALSRLRVLGIVSEGRGPVLPAERAGQRRGE